MGHCDSSAQFRGGGEVFRAGERAAAAPAAARSGTEGPRLRPPRGLGYGAAEAAAFQAATSRHNPEPARAPGAWALLVLVRFYQVFLSPFLGGACKFYPTCSNYACEAIARHGARQGARLALKRLGRCRPFTPGGFDPVPDELESAAVSRAAAGSPRGSAQ